jgi:GT2 family glycosyltransferase
MNRQVRRNVGPVWVGMLDLDDGAPIASVSGPVRADHRQARVLVRLHGAPLGYVSVPALPESTLSERVQAAAAVELAQALACHAQWDQAADSPEGSPEWAAKVTCPHRFPTSSGGISVVIPTRNRPAQLRDCLRTLQRLSFEPFEVLVVDNAPSDGGTRAMVTELARSDLRIRYVVEPRRGRSSALNRGLAEASHEIVATTDDDVLADPGWLSAIAAGFAADPEVIGVTGLVCSSSLETGSERYFDARYPWGESLEPRRYDLADHRHHSPLYPFTAGVFGVGANFAMRRTAVVELGGFDPLLGVGTPQGGGEDLDMFLRIVLAGHRFSYLPSALIWHRNRADTKTLSWQTYAYGHGLGAYVAKHLRNRELRKAVLRHGFPHARLLAGRAHQASAASGLGTDGRQLALHEMLGVVPGAFRYWSAARRASQSAEGRR